MIKKNNFQGKNESKKDSYFLILVAQGRSGSTLLLRLLNEIEGFNICGENHCLTNGLYEFYNSIEETNKFVPKKEGKFRTYDELLEIHNNNIQMKKEYSGYEWYNIYNRGRIKQRLKALIIDMFNPDGEYRVWGFKEIRYGVGKTSNYVSFKKQLSFIRDLFPQVKYIFLTRELEQLLQSAWWSSDKENNKKILEKQQNLFSQYIEENPINSYRLTYKDIIKKTDNLMGMYKFLGQSFDEEIYEKIIKKK